MVRCVSSGACAQESAATARAMTQRTAISLVSFEPEPVHVLVLMNVLVLVLVLVLVNVSGHGLGLGLGLDLPLLIEIHMPQRSKSVIAHALHRIAMAFRARGFAADVAVHDS